MTRLRTALTPSQCVLNDEVAIDGTYIGKRKHSSKHKPQHLVAGFIELGTNKVRFHRELHKDRNTVETLIQAYVKPNAYIYTDELQSYDELYLLGYHHTACNHSKGIFGVSNYIEAVWSSLKRSLIHIYRNLAFTAIEMDYILREYELRHNEPALFYNVINYLKLCGCSKLFK